MGRVSTKAKRAPSDSRASRKKRPRHALKGLTSRSTHRGARKPISMGKGSTRKKLASSASATKKKTKLGRPPSRGRGSYWAGGVDKRSISGRGKLYYNLHKEIVKSLKWRKYAFTGGGERYYEPRYMHAAHALGYTTGLPNLIIHFPKASIALYLDPIVRKNEEVANKLKEGGYLILGGFKMGSIRIMKEIRALSGGS